MQISCCVLKWQYYALPDLWKVRHPTMCFSQAHWLQLHNPFQTSQNSHTKELTPCQRFMITCASCFASPHAHGGSRRNSGSHIVAWKHLPKMVPTHDILTNTCRCNLVLEHIKIDYLDGTLIMPNLYDSYVGCRYEWSVVFPERGSLRIKCESTLLQLFSPIFSCDRGSRNQALRPTVGRTPVS